MAKSKVSPPPVNPQARPETRLREYLNQCCEMATRPPQGKAVGLKFHSLSEAREVSSQILAILRRKRYFVFASPCPEKNKIHLYTSAAGKTDWRKVRPTRAMQKRYREFNRKYFGNRLPHSTRVCQGRDSSGVAAGQFFYYFPTTRTPAILLDLKALGLSMDHLLAHEMAHQALEWRRLRDKHGATFKREMRRLEKAGAFQRHCDGLSVVDMKTGKCIRAPRKIPF